MIWVWATVALAAGWAAGFRIARRFRPPVAVIVMLSVVVLAAVAAAVYASLIAGERGRAIVELSAGFGVVSGLRIGGGVMATLMSAGEAERRGSESGRR